MTLPWDLPGSTGVGPGTATVIAFEGGEHCADERFYSVHSARRKDSLIDAASPLLAELQRFATAHRLVVTSHRNGSLENWALLFDYQRMQRAISISIQERAGAAGSDISLWGTAVWYATNDGHPEFRAPHVVYSVKETRRVAGITEGDVPAFRHALETALRDAKAFTVDDLDTRPAGCRPELHNA